MKRSIINILLLFCLVAPVTTTLIFLKYQKRLVRKEIKRKIIAGIDKEELVLLKFTEDDMQCQLKWEHSKEFEFKGEMYDVVESQTLGDTTFFWCWWDYKETRLNKQLSNLLTTAWGNNPVNKEQHKRLISFFKLLYYAETQDETLEPCGNQIDLSFCQQILLSTVYYSPPAPPPEIG